MNKGRAIGRIIKRYRTILRNCHMRNTLGPLAVAGMLLMGSAGGAYAVTTPAYWEQPSVTIGNGETQTVDELYDFEYADPDDTTSASRNTRTTSLTLAGGTLIIRNEAQLKHNIFADSPGMSLDIQSGTLQLDASGGSIYAKSITISGGSVTLGAQQGTSIKTTLSSSSGITITGGTVELGKSANLMAGLTSLFEVSGNSVLRLRGDGTANLNIYGGNFLLDDSATITVENGADADFNVMGATITGSSTIDIEGTFHARPWRSLPNETVNINQTGGTVTLSAGNGGPFVTDMGCLYIDTGVVWQLNGGKIVNNGYIEVMGLLDLTNAGNSLTNNAFLTVRGNNLLGKISTGRIIMDDAQLAGMLQTEGTQVTVDKYGILDLGESARIDADLFRSALDTTSTAPRLAIYNGGKLEVTTLTLSGRTMEMAAEGQISLNSLTLDTPELALTSGKILLKGESGSALNAAGGLRLAAAAAADAELRLGHYDSETGTLATGGTLAADITAATGTVSVAAGTWTLNAGKTLDIQSGSLLAIGGFTDANYQSGSSMPAKLVINGTLLSADAGNGSQGVNVGEAGTLEAGKNILLTGTDRINGLNTIDVAAGGYLRVTGLGTITKDDLAAMQGNLMTGAGTFDIADAVIVDSEVRPDGTIDYDDLPPGGVTSDTYRDAVVVNVNGPLSGNFAGVELASGGSISVNAGTTLVLNGSQGGDLITDSNGALAGLSTSGAFYLGEAGQGGSGAVGDVSLTSAGASLTAQGGGSYSAGTISAVNPNEGAVRSTGAALTADAIGSAGNPVGLVESTDGGSIVSLSDINARVLKLTSGDVQSKAAITAQRVDIQNGTLRATGDITLKGDGTSAGQMVNGDIISDGSIILQDAFTGTGHIQAAGNIQATSINMNKSPYGLWIAAGGSFKADYVSAASITAKRLQVTNDVQLSSGNLTLSGRGPSEASSIGGNLTAYSADVRAGDLAIGGTLKLYGDSRADIENLSLKGAVNWIGTGADTQGSRLTVSGTLSLNGNVLAVDPAWGGEASNVAVNSINDTASAAGIVINGGVAVGQNAYAAIGTADNAWLPAQTPGGLSQDGITAALGIFRPVSLAAGGKLYVNGALADAALVDGKSGAYDAASADSAIFAPGSLLVINGKDADIRNGTAAAITFENGKGSVTAENGAKLCVTDAVANTQYSLLSGVSSVTLNGGWQGDNVLTSSRMLGLIADVDDAAGTVTLRTVLNDARTAFPGLSDGMAAAVNRLYAPVGDPSLGWTDLADVDSPNMGVRFLSRATDSRFVGNGSEPAVRTIESAARMAVAGAVPQMTKMAADAAASAVAGRMSLAGPAGGLQSMDAEGKLTGRDTSGFALWISPTWQNRSGYNMDAGHLDGGFNGNIGGISLGADYTFENALRAGVALSLGGGYAVSAGDFADTTNSMSYWGVEAYAGWRYKDFALMADAGYTGSYHKLEQELGAGMQMRDLTADVQAGAWQAGLRAEYRFDGSVLDVIPHVGARYMNLTTWGYDVKSNGTLLEADSMTQHIWTFPVGVTFSQDFTLESGWFVRPSLDVTLIPAAGDVRANGDVRFTGLPGMYEMESQVMDYLTWQGSAGLEFGCDNMSLGVSYTVQTGQTGTGHGVFAAFRYEF